MPRFYSSEYTELKAFLKNSDIHDAEIKSFRYECGEGNIKINTYNPIFDVKIDFTCYDVELALATKGTYIFIGSRNTIISLTAEENLSYLKNYVQKLSESMDDCIYLLFQMLSGGELHIVSRSVTVEISR